MHRSSLSARKRAEAGVQEICASNNISKCKQFKQKQSKSKRKQGLFKCERRVFRKIITKSESEINKSCFQIERPRSRIKIGKSPISLWELLQREAWHHFWVGQSDSFQLDKTFSLISKKEVSVFFQTFRLAFSPFSVGVRSDTEQTKYCL